MRVVVETQWSVIHRLRRWGQFTDMWHQGRYLDEFERLRGHFRDACEAYARGPHAIALLNEVAASNASKEDKKECYVLLGRAYFAKDMMDKAKWALGNLAALSPPRIELDPVNEETYRYEGRRADAVKYYERYLAVSPDGEDAVAAQNAIKSLKE